MLHSMVICFQLARIWHRNIFAVQPHGIAPGRPVRLARSAYQLAPPAREAPRPKQIPSLAEKSTKTVMVISPDPYCRGLLGTLLRGDGYEVTSLPGIEPSPSGLAPEDCDCLIIDIDLPDAELVAQAHIDFAARMRGKHPVILIADRSSWVPAQLGLPTVSKRARRSRVLRGVHKSLFGG
jgi:hypothetical protein